MKLRKIFENEQISTIILLFDKLKRSETFLSSIRQIINPSDKYLAIVKFAELLGITEDKLDSFITNMKNVNKKQNGETKQP